MRTPEIDDTGIELFLIKLNEEPQFLVGTEESARLALDSLAHQLITENTSETRRVYSRIDNENQVSIKIEEVGYIYNSWYKQFTLTYSPISTCKVLKSRLEKNVDREYPDFNSLSDFGKEIAEKAQERAIRTMKTLKKSV